jgi:hypothetical protein
VVRLALLGPEGVAPRQVPLSSRQASVAIWQRATHGHYRYAPLLRTAPGDWSRRNDRVTWKIMHGHSSNPIGVELHRLLHDYADALGHRIDAAGLGE